MDSIDIFPWWIDINAVQRRKAPTWIEHEQRPFWFRTEFQKGHSFFIEFSENYHMWISRDFLRRRSLENPGFFYFQKGRWLSAPIPGRSPVSGRTALFVFYEQYPVPEKGRRRKWRSKVKNPNQASSKPNRTRPEYRSHTGPPAQTEKPVCTASPLCEGCPFPSHGFLCRGEDGECMRTRLMKLSDKEEPKWICHFPPGGRWNSPGAVIHLAHELFWTAWM